MELEVRVVRGMEGCYVSLPLLLIQTLESTYRSSSGHLPPVVALELRSRLENNQIWTVAWSGSPSSSSSIEIAQQFAECILLPDHTTVQVRAIPNLAKATLVTIEPHTEDDWEILELNVEHAETAILKQVGIVHEAMRFPLWLHGQTVITFIVVSTFPRKSMVQLVPGTEVAVAPKRRKIPGESHEDSSMTSSGKGDFTVKALLRIQDADSRFTHKCEFNGMEMSVALTSAVFVHPETAKLCSLDSLQPVVLEPRLVSKEMDKYHATENPKIRSNSTSKEVSNGMLTEKKDVRQTVVHLLISNSVAKGHVMLSQSLRRYLRSGLHSWIYVRKYIVAPKKETSSFSLSPCEFKMLGKKEARENSGVGDVDNLNNRQTKNMLLQTDSDPMDTIDWSSYERFIAAFSNDSPGPQADEGSMKSNSKKGISGLMHAWFLAQLDAIASNTGARANSLVLGNKTLLHFELKAFKSKLQTSYNGSVEIRSRTGESSASIIYLLSTSEGSVSGGRVTACEFTIDEGISKDSKLINLNFLLGKLQLAEGISLYSVKERLSKKCLNMAISSLSWMGTTASDVTNRLMVLLSSASAMFFGAYDLPFPGHVLICGPPGSGKKLLATTVAKYMEAHKDVLAHVVFVSCSQLALEKSPNVRQALSGHISEALDHAPSVVVLDDLDSIIASSSDPEGSQLSASSVSLTQFLTDIIDEYEEKRRNSCVMGPIAFIACAQGLTNIPQNLSSSGRFDFHVQLPAPAAAERGALLKHEIQKRSLHCSDEILFDVASSCDGYDAYDLEILVDRSVHAAIGRFVSCDMAFEEQKKPTLDRDDFTQAMKGFLPVAMRDITKSAAEGGRGGWEDVGGLIDIRNAIKEVLFSCYSGGMIELPSKFPNVFSQAPLRMRSNVLLYGPPGCGKTHIVGAAAAACSLRFISVKGPELLNKYIGASEQAVRDIFSKAASAAPCLLFFDEFDSIAPKRGHDNTGVTDRVVNQFLTELDGVEVLTGVFVFAATSRPDLLDAALLRPGRLDRLLFCDFPSQHERFDILSVLSRKLPMAKDIDLETIAYVTEGFSGADLQALLSDAQLAAVHDLLESTDGNKPGNRPVITDTLLKSIASKARPSVSEAEKGRLYNIYSQFLDAKRSVAAQSRDAKGKRATLA